MDPAPLITDEMGKEADRVGLPVLVRIVNDKFDFQ